MRCKNLIGFTFLLLLFILHISSFTIIIKNIICLPRELGDVLSPDPRPYGRGDFMSTYEEFMVIIAIASLIVSILNLTHKK